jgi:hypothetical protein
MSHFSYIKTTFKNFEYLKKALEQLNIALSGLTYTSSPDYYGQDWISVYVNDMGNKGSGGPQWVNEIV